MLHRKTTRVLALLGGASTTLMSAPACAQAGPRRLTIISQPLDRALGEFARAADVQVLYAPKLTRGQQSSEIRYIYPAERALRALLAGTRLRIKRIGSSGRTFTLEAVPAMRIAGRVLNGASGRALPGATVRIRGLDWPVFTDRNGAYRIGGLAAGSYRLTFSYAGFRDRSVAVDLVAGGADQDVRLTPDALPPEEAAELLVIGRREGQALAINLQRNADSQRTVVSADALGQTREGNIGDALVRLPGLSVETRAGVQRTATIRGLAAQYNAVTVDGLRMTNVDGNRDFALDSFPSNMLTRLSVIKAATPDMSSDAIGGTVDLVTPSAFARPGRHVEAEIGGTYNARMRNWNHQAALTASDTLANGQIGILASVAYYHDERGYDVVQTGYAINADGTPAISRALYYDRREIKDRIGAGLSLDYRPSAETSVFARALYSYDYRKLNHRSTDYRPNTATQFGVTGQQGSSTGARIDLVTFYREPKNVFQMYYGGVQHRAGDWEIAGRLAWSAAEKSYPVTLQITNSIDGVDLSYDRAVPDFPAFRVDNGVTLTDRRQIAFRQLDVNQVPRSEEEWTLDARAAREFEDGERSWRLEAGVRGSWKDAAQAQPLTARYTALRGTAAADLLESYVNPRFLKKSDGRGILLPYFPDWRAYRAIQENDPGRLAQDAAAAQFVAQTIAASEFSIAEDIYAGYAQATVAIGDFRLIGGVRLEHTELQSAANSVVVTATGVSSVPRRAAARYTNVLPSLHLRYAALGGSLVVRSSVSTGISRPAQTDLAPSVQENAQANQRVIGNPSLVPVKALSLDAGAEYFFAPLALLSATIFYKDVEDFVFGTSRIAPDGVDERTRANGDGGKIRGVELAWVQQFGTLPLALSGLGVEANFTYLDTRAVYPGRPERLPMVNSPRYILNGILSYTRGPLDVRLSYNRLPRRIEAIGADGSLDSYFAENATVDLAIRFKLLGQQALFLNIKNLTNEPTVTYQGARTLPTAVVYYGAQFNFGLRLNI